MLNYESRQYHKAVAAFEEALAWYGADESHYFYIVLWLGNCYEGLAMYSKAKHYFREVLLSPHSTEVDKVSAAKGLSRLAITGENE